MRSFSTRPLMTAALLALSLGLPAPVAAQSDGSFDLELNNTESVDGGCRLTFVAKNATGTALEQAAYDVAVFDDTGAVSDRLILEFGRLPQDKTRVVQFLLDRDCTQVSRLLLNGAEQCTPDAGGESRICMDALAPSSRTDVQFGS